MENLCLLSGTVNILEKPREKRIFIEHIGLSSVLYIYFIFLIPTTTLRRRHHIDSASEEPIL